MDTIAPVLGERWGDLSFDEAIRSVTLLALTLFTCHTGLGLVFLYVDITHTPTWMMQYKIQPHRNPATNKDELRKLFRLSTFNIIALAIPYAFLHYVLHKLRGSDLSWRPPTVTEVAVGFPVFLLAQEAVFYYAHRLLHSNYFYNSVHKIHHEWTAPIGLGAIYAHPFEFCIGKISMVAAGPLLMGSCQVLTMAWFGFAFALTTLQHCGYHLPFLPSTEFHDYHHLNITGNYGLLGFLDAFHNTQNPDWKRSKQSQRH